MRITSGRINDVYNALMSKRSLKDRVISMYFVNGFSIDQIINRLMANGEAKKPKQIKTIIKDEERRRNGGNVDIKSTQ
jgi:hypothetical protein